MNIGKTSGWIVIGLAVAALLLAGGFVGSGLAVHRLTVPGAVLGFILFGALPALVLGAIGVYLVVKGKSEAAEAAEAEKLQRLLGMIQSHGQVSLGQAMVEMRMTREQITQAIYDLVSLGLFIGYIDWESMTFYASDAAKVVSNICPNCGGIREFVGKGIVKCPYCGATLFIPPDAPNTRAEPKPPAQKPPEPQAGGQKPPSSSS